MIYVDALTGCLAHDNWRHTRSCHLMADSLPELIRFGKKIGCSPNWVQTEGALDHFDLTARMREKAVAHGAMEIDRKQVVELMRRRSMPNTTEHRT